MKIKDNHKKLAYILVAVLCFSPFMSPPVALFLGLLFSFIGLSKTTWSQYTSPLLQYSIVLMGFGMNLSQVVEASKSGFFLTAISVSFVMVTGILLGKILKVDKKVSILIASGTAICGGSAIAAVAPILKSKDSQTSFSLMVVFVLNAAALFIFPFVGHLLNLSQVNFGNWAAIGVHDTSSVVGVGAVYGAEALEIATTVKLIRALWIIPLSLLIVMLNKNEEKGKIKLPWFIAFFVLSILVAYFMPQYQPTFKHLYWLGRVGMLLALFLIGSNISLKEVRKTGFRSFALGILLWFITASSSLIFILFINNTL